MEMARDCAIVGIGQSVLSHRSLKIGISSFDLLTYPETIGVARLITNPAFNTRMLQPGHGPSGRHAISLQATTVVFPKQEDDESWRAAAKITTRFDAIARNLEKRTYMEPPRSTQASNRALDNMR